MDKGKSGLWPIKCVPVNDGVLCVYDYPGVVFEASQVSIDVVLGPLGEKAILVQDVFLVPTSVLGLGEMSSVILRMAASDAGEVVANIFAVIELDVRALTKIELLESMSPAV